MKLSRHRAVHFREGKISVVDEPIVIEDTVRIFFNGQLVTEMVASADQLRELGAGFAISEGLARSVDGVTVNGSDIHVLSGTMGDPTRLKKEVGSSGGTSFPAATGRIVSDIRISPSDVSAIMQKVETETWRKTGAVHCSVLFCGGKCIARSSDVGRHNTVDKVIGHAVLNGIDLSRCVIACTGRQPAGMVRKSARAGIPVVLSRAASTDKGIAAAEEAGITLVCFSRGERFTVYACPERVTGLTPAQD
jgi:FdhD protein